MSETKTERGSTMVFGVFDCKRDIAHERQWPPYGPYDFWNDPGEDDENDGEPIEQGVNR